MNINEAYQILWIPNSANQGEVKKAFRKKALVAHPDRWWSTSKFQELNEAYQLIMKDLENRSYNTYQDHASEKNYSHSSHEKYSLNELSAKQFKGILNILTMFVFIDWHISDNEIAVIVNFVNRPWLEKFELDLPTFIKKTLNNYSHLWFEKLVSVLYKNLDILFDLKISDKQKIIVLVDELMIADWNIHKNEKFLLDIMTKYWLLKSEWSNDWLTEKERNEVVKIKGEIQSSILIWVGVLVVWWFLSISLPVVFIWALIAWFSFIFNWVRNFFTLQKHIKQKTQIYTNPNDLNKSSWKTPRTWQYVVKRIWIIYLWIVWIALLLRIVFWITGDIFNSNENISILSSIQSERWVDPETFYFWPCVYLHWNYSKIDNWDNLNSDKKKGLEILLSEVAVTKLDYSKNPNNISDSVYIGPICNCNEHDKAKASILKSWLEFPWTLAHWTEWLEWCVDFNQFK